MANNISKLTNVQIKELPNEPKISRPYSGKIE